MPSEFQSGSDDGKYRNEAHKMLTTKTKGTVFALIRGIQDEERARLYLSEVNRLGVEGEVKSRVVERVRELSQ